MGALLWVFNLARYLFSVRKYTGNNLQAPEAGSYFDGRKIMAYYVEVGGVCHWKKHV